MREESASNLTFEGIGSGVVDMHVTEAQCTGRRGVGEAHTADLGVTLDASR